MEKRDHEEEEEQQAQGYVAYVRCSFCTTILWVGVPCSTSLLRMVTVRCGHCTALLSEEININCSGDVEALPELCEKAIDGPEEADQESMSTAALADTALIPLVNKPPEKRQRAPSTYNCFIREEIRRIKASDPNISHKEAFSMAAKNWAHFPRIQQKSKSY